MELRIRPIAVSRTGGIMDAENQATIERACEQFGELAAGELARIERVRAGW